MNNPQKFPPFREEEIRKVFGTDAGRQLISYLSRDGGAALKQAAAALKSGDQAGAAALLQPLMQTEEAKALVDQINQK